MSEYCKKPCKHCPFRNDITPFLHPDKASELAYLATNPYSDFYCHKTLEYVENEYSEDGEDLTYTNKSLICAGHLTLRAQEGLKTPEGFEPSWEQCYTDTWDMIASHEEEWDKKIR